jgi:hypothetical protein
MATPAEVQFALQMVKEAVSSGHPFPGYAAAEACLESWDFNSPTGCSGLAARDKDVFGLKEPNWWTGQVDKIQTREVIDGASEMVMATWPVFTTYADCFAARLKVLQGLPSYYGEALEAKSGEEFVRLVSASWLSGDALPLSAAHPCFTFPGPDGPVMWQFNAGRWSTAPNRASQVLAVYNAHPEIFVVPI